MKHLVMNAGLYWLRLWARVALGLHKPYIIGITGSMGKSTTREAVHAALVSSKKVMKIEGNSQSGIPLGILGMKAGDYSPLNWLLLMLKAPFCIWHMQKSQLLVVEMGIDGPNPPANMGYLTTILQPHMAIFLNVNAAHTQQFEEGLPNGKTLSKDEILDAITREKARIISPSAKVIIANADDVRALNAARARTTAHQEFLTFSTQGETEDMALRSYEVSTEGTKTVWDIQGHHIELSLSYALSRESIGAVVVALLAADALGVDVQVAAKSLQDHLILPAGRSSLLRGIQQTVILDSSYNASAGSVLSLLAMAKHIAHKEERPLVVVLGDMRELGDKAQEEHERVSQELTRDIAALYLVGPLTRQFVLPRFIDNDTAPHTIAHFHSARELGTFLQNQLPKNALVFIKGSQNTIYLEEVVKALLQDPNDVSKLCRRGAYWDGVREKYFVG